MRIIVITLSIAMLILTSCNKQEQSVALKRFREFHNSSWSNKLPDNPNVYFSFNELVGLSYQSRIIRRDPSDIIKVNGKYFLWYSRSSSGGVMSVGVKKATDILRAYPWDLADIWLATSEDGVTWNEIGPAIHRGTEGEYDARSVYSPNICNVNGKYYMYYQIASSLLDADVNDFKWTKIGMSWSDSPYGPWTKAKKSILSPGDYGNPGNYPIGPIVQKGDWDALTCSHPSILHRDDKFFLYYKSCYFQVSNSRFESGDLKDWVEKDGGIPMGWGVAVADNPEGPFIKSELNPVVVGGNECIVYPLKDGICAMLSSGPEMNTIQYSTNGIDFTPVHAVNQVPKAAGLFRPDISDATGWSEPMDWGISHVLEDTEWHYLNRFEMNQDLRR